MMIALLAALALSLGVFATACGGDDGGGGDALSLEGYFPAVKEVMDGMEDDSDEIEQEISDRIDDATEVEEMLNALADGLDQFVVLADGVHDDLDDIEPPSEASDSHRELIALFGATSSALSDIRADVDEIDPGDSQDAILEQITELSDSIGNEFGTLGTQGELICFELQGLADDNDIETDLECGE
jgi:hypothetical protein